MVQLFSPTFMAVIQKLLGHYVHPWFAHPWFINPPKPDQPGEEEEERAATPEMEAIFTEEEDETMGEMIAELDIEDTEVTLETELLSNNHQITQTNEPTDIDWF